MALAFLEHPGQTPSDSFLLQLSHIWVPIADNALAASEIIDHPDRAEETGRMSAANSSLYRKKQGCSPVFFHTSLSMITDRKRKV